MAPTKGRVTYTSHYGNVKNIPAHLKPVGISQRVPKTYTGAVDKRLAPSWKMLKMSRADYDQHFAAILNKLDPAAVYEALGENAVLLCWETPGIWCHRRLVAEWFEAHLGVVIPELGFDRKDCPAYDVLPAKATAKAAPKKPALEVGPLFK